MALAARLLPPMARTRRLGLSCLLRSCRFFALGTVETLDQVADRCLLRVHFCRQGRFAFDRPRVLRLPVIGLPRELDIGLLRQHHALLGKRRGVVAVPCREIRGGVALRVGTLHRIRYSRFIWNVLDFLLGAMGWPKLYRCFAAALWPGTRCRAPRLLSERRGNPPGPAGVPARCVNPGRPYSRPGWLGRAPRDAPGALPDARGPADGRPGRPRGTGGAPAGGAGRGTQRD